jgi:chemotaxis protein MotB
VTQVRGYADQNLRKADDPLDSSNRRISLIVQYRIKAPDEKSEEPASGEGKSGEAKKPAAEGGVKE